MGIGTSIFLIAAGAILRWGITDSTVASIKLDVVGTILMVVGVIGLIASLLWAGIWTRRRGPGYGDPPYRDPVYRDR